MSKIFFTITGTCYRYGHEFIEPGMTVRITKEASTTRLAILLKAR